MVVVFTEVSTTTSFSEAQQIGNPAVQRIGLAVDVAHFRALRRGLPRGRLRVDRRLHTRLADRGPLAETRPDMPD
ncbi:hypothetical protein [Jiangella asiatica]|uniref:Uncharacterized protein n=1 Tax=Jiangella asiatica TaxID=2530372 RepID=A0A4R5DAB0_9ACTN|nr:hypothetical protein [Jiangella asiatica]TDE08900.1 hypothetical protein E1269_15860 [Jiangella asiatica]